MGHSSTESSTAQHVWRALRALELLAEGPQTQADVARELAVHRRTARRLLARLVDEGYAEPTRHGRFTAYRATSRLAVLGRRVAESLDVLELSRAHLAAVDADRAGNRYIAMPGEGSVSVVHVETLTERPAPGSAKVLARGGPLHATAAGKVFLSADPVLAGEVLNHELLMFTTRTLTTRVDLLLELALVRERGFALEEGEHHAEMLACASGVRDHSGHTVAALGAAPREAESLSELGALVHEAALACSRELGAPSD